jgi:RNA polymerase sigma-70 factor, ECF subfamily
MALDEKLLVSELKNGNSKAFEKLFFHYFPRLHSFIHKITGNGQEAEDLVQDVFIAIWNNKEKIDENRSFGSFVFKIAKNKALNLIKHRLCQQVFIQYSEGEYVSMPGNDLNTEEFQSIIEEAVSSLPEKTREIFLLSRHEGLTYLQIAEKLRITQNVVDHEIRKALKQFKSILKAKGYL